MCSVLQKMIQIDVSAVSYHHVISVNQHALLTMPSSSLLCSTSLTDVMLHIVTNVCRQCSHNPLVSNLLLDPSRVIYFFRNIS